MANNFVAHTPPDDDHERWQTMREHGDNVANLAASYAVPFGAKELARWAGWLHDVGKYSEDFQKYLRDCHMTRDQKDGKPKPGSAEHKRAGTKLAWEMMPPIIRHILAPCVLGHHGGLHAESETGTTLREAQDDPKTAAELAKAIQRARVDFPELNGAPPMIADIAALSCVPKEPASGALHIEMLTRFVFSCLVDADGLDTEAHFSPKRAEMRRVPTLAEIGPRWMEMLRLSQEALQANAPDTPVSRVRREVYDACLAAAEHQPGVFTLTVPTGGGKTRSSLAFALAHALRHERTRIIYAIPYTSIIDQTARTFREILGDEGILEHHSALDVRRADREGEVSAQEENAREQRRRMAAENWDAPLVVTTTVQFFESLFANRTSPCRKLHNIAGSVVILDEAQTLPPHLLT
ncbi:MAG: ATP-dependent helicase SrmB, partial [Capsulimonas sp.]|nr:ATP-dependent helicase SrmB [Capsulimonas sp.]